MTYRFFRASSFVQGCVLLLTLGCNALTDAPDLPVGTQDISSFFNREGAFSFYNYSVANFGYTLAMSSLASGLFTDELKASLLVGNTDFLVGRTAFGSDGFVQLDARKNQSNLEAGVPFGNISRGPYSFLHTLRADVMQGNGIFAEYTTESSVFRGHLYAILGYAEITLADMYCSGVPLSTVDFKKDWTYRPGSTSVQVYQHALGLFDTAIALSTDSSRILNLARIGKGRALLALGQYDAAAEAVSDVPLDYKYQQATIWRRSNSTAVWTGSVTMSDREGGTGLPYLSSRDPRTDSMFVGLNTYRTRLYFPKKYPLNVASQFTIASGVEAELIIAEAHLQGARYGDWLYHLNRIRRDAIVPSLPDLVDPGTLGARVDTLFKERAFWLYLTGHRIGDLRRLVRQYQRDPNTLYSAGEYPGSGGGTYGSDVVIPIDRSLEMANPLFTGCVDYDA